MIPIDKGIPVPARKARYDAKYPWDAMEVGDSFAVPIKDRNQMPSAVCAACKRFDPKKFISRLVDANTVRVWRVA